MPVDGLAVGSNYFQVYGRLRWNDHVLEQRSLVQRLDGHVNVLRTGRVTTIDDPGLPHWGAGEETDRDSPLERITPLPFAH